MKIENIDLKQFEELCRLIYLGYIVINADKLSNDIKPITQKAIDNFFNLNNEYKSNLLDLDNNQYMPNEEIEFQLKSYIEKIMENK